MIRRATHTDLLPACLLCACCCLRPPGAAVVPSSIRSSRDVAPFLPARPRRVTQTRSVDTELSSSSYATGFIVDRKRGLILTNRHVVTPGG